jgi:ribosome-binding factor A
MKREVRGARGAGQGPSQRQLRAGELIRHALVDILRQGELHDEALEKASVTVTEVRLSPDLKHAVCFVEPLGAGVAHPDSKEGSGGAQTGAVVAALNRHARFLRGRLGREIDMKFTPDLKFVHDESFDEAARMDALFNRPEVRRDIEDGEDR